MFTIDAADVIAAAARLQHSSTPVRLTAHRRANSPGSTSTSLPTGPVIPALLTSPVTTPTDAVVSNSASTSAGEATSACTGSQRAPAERTAAAVSSARPVLDAYEKTMSCPSAAIRRQIAAPMPRLPPVTMVSGLLMAAMLYAIAAAVDRRAPACAQAADATALRPRRGVLRRRRRCDAVDALRLTPPWPRSRPGRW